MNSSRSKKAIRNTLYGFSAEIVTVICGLILPRLILVAFGSTYNGITSSISQFISCIALMKAGIGGATKAALYKPLAEHNDREISEIVNQTAKFMRKIALIFAGATLIFAVIYPLWIRRDFDWWFTFSLIIIIAFSTFGQYYFGLTYQMLLVADMKQYVNSVITIIVTILNTIVAVVLIKAGGSIHVVKLGSSFAHLIGPLLLYLYTKRNYNIDSKAITKNDKITQRWDAVGHEVANFVNTNTDIMVLTVFSSLNEISVYTVYNYVIANIRVVLMTFVNSFGSAFGNMYAKKEYDTMRSNLGIYELIVFSLVSVIYSVTLVMMVPFAVVYTKGVYDVNYSRPLFSAIITMAGVFSCIRMPYQTIVTAAGDFKGTRNGAFVEAGINILLSILLVIRYGLIGVAIGTLFATVFRTFQYSLYIRNHIINRKFSYFIKHLMIFGIIIGLVYGISSLITIEITHWGQWILKSAIVTILATLLTLIFNLVFYKNDLHNFISKIRGNYRLGVR